MNSAAFLQLPFSMRRSSFELNLPNGLLGKGSFGTVVLSYRRSNGKYYAVKCIVVPEEHGQRACAQIREEYRIHSSLMHPNIVRLHGCFKELNSVYMVLEYCEGGEMYHMLKRSDPRRFPHAVAQRFFSHVCEAMLYLQKKHIVHRDIKPENLLMARGMVKIADFGWSAYAPPNGKYLYTFCGTIDYLSPEMLAGRGHGLPTDIWALGILLFEMLVGNAPFAGRNEKATVVRIVSSEPKYPNWVDPLAAELITSLLAKRAVLRPTVPEVLRSRFLSFEFKQEHEAFFSSRSFSHLAPVSQCSDKKPAASLQVCKDDIHRSTKERLKQFQNVSAMFEKHIHTFRNQHGESENSIPKSQKIMLPKAISRQSPVRKPSVVKQHRELRVNNYKLPVINDKSIISELDKVLNNQDANKKKMILSGFNDVTSFEQNTYGNEEIKNLDENSSRHHMLSAVWRSPQEQGPPTPVATKGFLPRMRNNNLYNTLYNKLDRVSISNKNINQIDKRVMNYNSVESKDSFPVTKTNFQDIIYHSESNQNFCSETSQDWSNITDQKKNNLDLLPKSEKLVGLKILCGVNKANPIQNNIMPTEKLGTNSRYFEEIDDTDSSSLRPIVNNKESQKSKREQAKLELLKATLAFNAKTSKLWLDKSRMYSQISGQRSDLMKHVVSPNQQLKPNIRGNGLVPVNDIKSRNSNDKTLNPLDNLNSSCLPKRTSCSKNCKEQKASKQLLNPILNNISDECETINNNAKFNIKSDNKDTVKDLTREIHGNPFVSKYKDFNFELYKKKPVQMSSQDAACQLNFGSIRNKSLEEKLSIPNIQDVKPRIGLKSENISSHAVDGLTMNSELSQITLASNQSSELHFSEISNKYNQQETVEFMEINLAPLLSNIVNKKGTENPKSFERDICNKNERSPYYLSNCKETNERDDKISHYNSIYDSTDKISIGNFESEEEAKVYFGRDLRDSISKIDNPKSDENRDTKNIKEQYRSSTSFEVIIPNNNTTEIDSQNIKEGLIDNNEFDYTVYNPQKYEIRNVGDELSLESKDKYIENKLINDQHIMKNINLTKGKEFSTSNDNKEPTSKNIMPKKQIVQSSLNKFDQVFKESCKSHKFNPSKIVTQAYMAPGQALRRTPQNQMRIVRPQEKNDLTRPAKNKDTSVLPISSLCKVFDQKVDNNINKSDKINFKCNNNLTKISYKPMMKTKGYENLTHIKEDKTEYNIERQKTKNNSKSNKERLNWTDWLKSNNLPTTNPLKDLDILTKDTKNDNLDINDTLLESSQPLTTNGTQFPEKPVIENFLNFKAQRCKTSNSPKIDLTNIKNKINVDNKLNKVVDAEYNDTEYKRYSKNNSNYLQNHRQSAKLQKYDNMSKKDSFSYQYNKTPIDKEKPSQSLFNKINISSYQYSDILKNQFTNDISAHPNRRVNLTTAFTNESPHKTKKEVFGTLAAQSSSSCLQLHENKQIFSKIQRNNIRTNYSLLQPRQLRSPEKRNNSSLLLRENSRHKSKNEIIKQSKCFNESFLKDRSKSCKISNSITLTEDFKSITTTFKRNSQKSEKSHSSSNEQFFSPNQTISELIFEPKLDQKYKPTVEVVSGNIKKQSSQLSLALQSNKKQNQNNNKEIVAEKGAYRGDTSEIDIEEKRKALYRLIIDRRQVLENRIKQNYKQLQLGQDSPKSISTCEVAGLRPGFDPEAIYLKGKKEKYAINSPQQIDNLQLLSSLLTLRDSKIGLSELAKENIASLLEQFKNLTESLTDEKSTSKKILQMFNNSYLDEQCVPVKIPENHGSNSPHMSSSFR